MSEPENPNLPTITPTSAVPVPSDDFIKEVEELLKEAIPEKEEREKMALVIRHTMRTSSRSGPLPDPKELAAYNGIIPNGADRIMKMAEAQSNHRIQIETCVVTSQQKLEARGQSYGLI